MNKTELKKMKSLAERGDAEAQFQLGRYYDNVDGKSNTRDAAEAVKLYRLAAEQGPIKAQNNLGACFFNGEGVSKNLQEALNWFEKAAKAGNQKAKESVSRVRELLEIKKRKEAETCTTSTDSKGNSLSKMSVEDAVGMIAKLAMLDNINEAIEGIQSELDSIEDTLYTMQGSIERIEKAVAPRKKKNHK